MGIEPTTSRFYSHTLCACATTGLIYIDIYIRYTLDTNKNNAPTVKAYIVYITDFKSIFTAIYSKMNDHFKSMKKVFIAGLDSAIEMSASKLCLLHYILSFIERNLRNS